MLQSHGLMNDNRMQALGYAKSRYDITNTLTLVTTANLAGRTSTAITKLLLLLPFGLPCCGS
jgi:hypothetical protein